MTAPPKQYVPVDSVAPVILLFLGPEGYGEPGELIDFRIHARDNFGLTRFHVEFVGAFEDSGTIDLEQVYREINGTLRWPAPDGASANSPLVATLTLYDSTGHSARAQTTVYMKDSHSPLASVDFGGLHNDGSIRTGEPLDIYINAFDNHRLSFIGYELDDGKRDSVLSRGTGDSHAFRITVPPSWLMKRPVVKAWARDSSGNTATVFNVDGKQVPVYHWADRPVTSSPVSFNAEPAHVLYDPERDLVYLLQTWGDEGSPPRIDVHDAQSGVPLAPIPLPHFPYYMAFSPSGDSLVVTYRGDALGVVDLRAPLRTPTTIPINAEIGPSRLPIVAKAVGSHFFVVLTGALPGDVLLDVNFGTGAQQVRTDIDGGPITMHPTSLIDLPDGRLVIAPDAYSGTDYRLIYSPSTDSFVVTHRLRSVYDRQYSASPSGRFMMGNTVFSPTLDSLATVTAQDWDGYPPRTFALSPDGMSVYLATRYGYERVRLSDGLIIEQVNLDMAPRFLHVTADGGRVIAIGEFWLKIVDQR